MNYEPHSSTRDQGGGGAGPLAHPSHGLFSMSLLAAAPERALPEDRPIEKELLGLWRGDLSPLLIILLSLTGVESQKVSCRPSEEQRSGLRALLCYISVWLVSTTLGSTALNCPQSYLPRAEFFSPIP